MPLTLTSFEPGVEVFKRIAEYCALNTFVTPKYVLTTEATLISKSIQEYCIPKVQRVKDPRRLSSISNQANRWRRVFSPKAFSKCGYVKLVPG